MAENQCSACVRISIRVFLVFINLFYMLAAVGIIGSGIFTVVERDDMSILVGQDVTVTSVMIILVGVGVLIMSILGIIGAITNFWPLLSIYAFILALLVCIQITTTVLAFVYRSKAESNLSDQMLEYIKNYTTTASTTYNEESNAVIDLIQISFHCCGRDGPGDWMLYNTKYLVSNNGFPDSCACVQIDDDDDKRSVNIDDDNCYTPPLSNGIGIWKRGCNETVHNFIETNVKVFASAASVSGAIVILTFILTLLLVVLNVSTIRKERYYTRLQNGVSPQEPSLQEITYTANPMHQKWSDQPTAVV